MKSEDATPAVQVNAAQVWLKHSIQMHNIADLEERIRDLEEQVKVK